MENDNMFEGVITGPITICPSNMSGTTMPLPPLTQRWKYCPWDGQKIESDWNYCPKCGAGCVWTLLGNSQFT